jgi:hypothetical protein
MRADSTEYVGVPLTLIPAGVDLSIDTFDMAFVTSKTSVASSWHPAVWDAAKKVVKLLVGPGGGGVVIAPGKWVVLLRVHDAPEIPVIPASGSFTIDALV